MVDAFRPLSEKTAGNLLSEFARDLSTEKQMDFGIALTEVRRSHPELAEQARQEAIRGLNQSEEPYGAFAGRPRSFELHKKARARAAERDITYAAARKQIEDEDPELSAAARSEGGMQIKDIKMLPGIGEMYVMRDTELGPTKDPNGVLASIIEDRARHKRIGYRLALSEVCRDYPKLAAAARAQVMGLKNG